MKKEQLESANLINEKLDYARRKLASVHQLKNAPSLRKLSIKAINQKQNNFENEFDLYFEYKESEDISIENELNEKIKNEVDRMLLMLEAYIENYIAQQEESFSKI